MSKSFILLNILLFTLSIPLTAQGIFHEKNDFTRQDSLRGMITEERSWWDLNYYHLDIRPKLYLDLSHPNHHGHFY